jgi:trigger factor
MDIKTNEKGTCRKEMVATLTYEELVPYFEKAISDFRKKTEIPGFRKGKAPIDMIKKMYGQSIEYTETENIANDVFRNYYIDNKINIYGMPELTDIDYKPKESMMFKVEFDFIPEITLKKYKELEFTKRKVETTEKIINDEYIRMMNQYAERVPDGQVLDENYVVTVDFQELDENGQIIIGESLKDQEYYLNTGNLVDSLKNVLKDIREGETRIWERESNDGEKVLKSEIKCTKVEKLVFPEINSEFIERITGKKDLSTEEDLKKVIKENIDYFFEEQSRKELEDEIIREIVQENEVEIPDKLIDNILEQNYNKYISQMQEHEKSAGEHHHHEHISKEDFFNSERAETVLYVKWSLLKDKIIETEKLEVTDADIEAFAEKSSKEYGISKEQLVEAYKKIEDINDRLIDGKLMDYLISQSKITEKYISPDPVEDMEETEQTEEKKDDESEIIS